MRTITHIVTLLLIAGPVGAQTQRIPMFVRDSARIAVYADGNLKTALTKGDDAQVAAASLGLGIGIRRATIDLLINTVGTAPAVKSNWGTTLLSPGSGSSLAAGLLEVRWLFHKYEDTPPAKKPEAKEKVAPTPEESASAEATRGLWKTGIRGYGSISSAKWQVNSNDETGVVVGGLGLGAFFALQGDTKNIDSTRNHTGAILDVGLAGRFIGGDIANDLHQSELDTAMARSGKVHVGIELGLQLYINGAKASLTYYAFGGVLGGKDVAGLTRGQVVAGFSVQSALFQGVLHKTKW
jgi:hypothetical protein